MIEACSGQETRRNAQGMARPFQALQRSILVSVTLSSSICMKHHTRTIV
ncbi:MAG: hypothetical protein P8179_24205 [Candidatus Thiodiazotropha sp.]